jgi:hypothetical protein
MSLLDTIVRAGGEMVMKELAGSAGMREDQTKTALEKLVPVLAGSLGCNVERPGGLDALRHALESGNHDRYLERPDLLRQRATIDDGNGILGHILGSKEVSREVARRTSDETGLDASLLKKLLPVAAAVLMGSLRQQTRAPSGGGGLGELLSTVLGAEAPNSLASDLIGLAQRAMR